VSQSFPLVQIVDWLPVPLEHRAIVRLAIQWPGESRLPNRDHPVRRSPSPRPLPRVLKAFPNRAAQRLQLCLIAVRIAPPSEESLFTIGSGPKFIFESAMFAMLPASCVSRM